MVRCTSVLVANTISALNYSEDGISLAATPDTLDQQGSSREDQYCGNHRLPMVDLRRPGEWTARCCRVQSLPVSMFRTLCFTYLTTLMRYIGERYCDCCSGVKSRVTKFAIVPIVISS